MKPLHRPLLAYSYRKQAVRLIAGLNPNYVHCHDLHTLWAGYFARRRLPGLGVVYDSHELERHRAQARPRRSERWLAARYENFLIRRVDRTIVACDSAADNLASLYRIPRPAVVRNCPDLSGRGGKSPAVPGPLAQDGENLTKLLYIGGVVRFRGLEQSIQALPLLPPRFVLVLLGNGTAAYLSELRDRAAALGVEGRLFLVPAVAAADLPGIARHAHLGLCLTQNVSLNNYYTLPNKLFEYIAAGLPVVGSDFPELRRIILGHDIGRVCRPDSPESIAECLLAFAGSDGYGKARENVRRIAWLYTWSEEKERLLDLYRGLPQTRRDEPARYS